VIFPEIKRLHIINIAVVQQTVNGVVTVRVNTVSRKYANFIQIYFFSEEMLPFENASLKLDV
jgi:hypothetical protein